MRNEQWIWLPVAAVSTSVYATTYLTEEQARDAIFPGGSFTQAFVTLSDGQVSEIERRTGVNVRQREVRAWKVAGGGHLIVDEVLGKHDFITYAIGLNTDGSVKQIEIMIYRESYGYQIRDEEWRRQFTGKTAAAPLKLERDIRNISGATLSCRHMADGIKRVLATHDVALK
jgi:hypothetical protein